MTAATRPIHAKIQCTALPVTLTLALLALISSETQAADLDEITLSGPTVKTIDHDLGTGLPIEQVTVTAQVDTTPAALTTDAGVARLKKSVREAARRVCSAADPLTRDDGTCARNAVASAQPQVNAIVARARSNSNG